MRAVPPVDLEDWRRIEPILDEILDLEPDERSDRLASLCAGDPELRVQVEAFLAADEAAGGFLDTPAGQYASDLLAEDGEETRKPAGADLPEALRQVGPYRLLREVGSGGMGVVYEAEDTRLGRRVAIKFLPPEYNRDRKANGRFLREARAASALDHPNLCTVYDVGEYEDRLYIVLAFYEGESLRERLRRGPLPIMEAREVAIQIARGLVRAHEAGIIHRDIKPANVMLTRRGEVKILDFGVAKLGGEEASLTPTGGSWGTPAYMSPEQARGEPVDGRADIWALGVVLYEMLAGRRPFGGEGVQEVLCAILTREPGPLERLRPDVPSELARVVERALAKVPAERYASAADFLADLESGRAPKVPASFHRLRRSRGLLAISVAVVVLVLLAWALRWLTSKPLRVAVLHPSVTSANGDPELSFVSSEVVDATLDTLLYLEGIQPLDPPEKDETGGSAAELKRAAEADEVLRPLLSCRKGGCSMTLRRVRMPEGDVLRTVGPFEVETGADNAQDLAGTLRFRLQEIYEDHPLRPDAPRAKVKDEDYSDYIQLKRRFDRYGQRLGDSDLQRLDTLLQRSPDLLEGWILAADIANSIRQRVRAFNYITQAERIAPHDPRPLFTRVRIEVDEKRLEDAKETLAKLVEMAPADARVLIAQADLLEAQGKLCGRNWSASGLTGLGPWTWQSWSSIWVRVKAPAAASAMSSRNNPTMFTPRRTWLQSRLYSEIRSAPLHSTKSWSPSVRPHWVGTISALPV
jgi:serine/threonine protein kinase